MHLEEKTIESKPIFKGRIIEVKLDRVLLPDGQESSREIVLHAGAVAIIAIDSEDKLYLVRQYRKPIEKTLLELPAGTLEAGEDPLHCARRELAEETGMNAASWKKLISYYSAPGFCNEILHIFLAEGLFYGGGIHTDQDEFVETVTMPFQQACEAVARGEIVDGKSIIAIQMLQLQRAAQ